MADQDYDPIRDGDPVALMQRCHEAEGLLEEVLPHLRSLAKVEAQFVTPPEGQRTDLVKLGLRVKSVVEARNQGWNVPPA